MLADLEVDLRANPNDSWVKDFFSTPNHGHVALIDLIRDLADTQQTLPRKSAHKYSVLERDPVRQWSVCNSTIYIFFCFVLYVELPVLSSALSQSSDGTQGKGDTG